MDDAAPDILERNYKPPHALTVAKALDHVDAHGRRFIGLSPLVVLGSVGEGGVDVSPRGGGPGFVGVSQDGRTLTLPDRPGNNRLDSLKNIAGGSGEVGLMFMIPGVDDIYRVNGTAQVVDDPDLAAGFEEFGKVPKTLVRVAVREAYLHCPTALMRADLWGDTYRIERDTLPSLASMITDQLNLPKPPTTHAQDVERMKGTL